MNSTPSINQWRSSSKQTSCSKAREIDFDRLTLITIRRKCKSDSCRWKFSSPYQNIPISLSSHHTTIIHYLIAYLLEKNSINLPKTMASETENLNKCFEVASMVVQKAGRVNFLFILLEFNSIKRFQLEKRNSGFSLQLIASRFWKSKNVKQKLSDIDLVTETDQEVEKLLINTLTAEFPHHR